MIYLVRRKNEVEPGACAAMAIIATNQREAREVASRWDQTHAEKWLDEKESSIIKIETKRYTSRVILPFYTER